MGDAYMGRILWVDLSKNEIWDEYLDDDMKSNYIGGYGIALKILLSRQKKGIDPLHEDSICGVMTGPLTGSGSIIGSRFTVFGKSPLTGTWGDANSGGYFGPQLKKAGYDGIFVTGSSEKPVYILIDEGRASIKNAENIWGRTTYETEDIIKKEEGKDVQVACIGPSGEKCNRFAAIITDKGRAAARFGLGGQWGSKNLKAIAIKGNIPVKVADEERFAKLRKKYIDQIIKEHVGASAGYQVGTPGYTEVGALNGDSPVKNWSGVCGVDFTAEQAEKINAENLFKYRTKKYGCYRCPIVCSGLVSIEEGPYSVEETHQPEYETMAAFGSNCGNSNLESIIMANDICNRYGIDTISAGSAVAFAIECYEKGLLTEEDTGGLELTWGNHEAIVELTGQIASCEGLGAILAEGLEVAAEKIGGDAKKYAIHVMGDAIAMHDPRFEPALGVIYKMFPGKHIQASQFCAPVGLEEAIIGFGTEKDNLRERAYQLKVLECLCNVVNVSGSCLFGFLSTTSESIGEFLSAATGREWTKEELIQAGETISNLRQLFNLREGANPVTADFPERALGDPPLEKGSTAGFTVNMMGLMEEYLKQMGWTHKGIPTREKLAELDIEGMSAELQSYKV
jgi:aldehyde:ferredoxin oxidoreductase